MQQYEQQYEQDGGWLKGTSKTAKPKARKQRTQRGERKITYAEGTKAYHAGSTITIKGKSKVVRRMGSGANVAVGRRVSSYRSYKATVDGAPFGTYFHGTPSAAAKKVVGKLAKSQGGGEIPVSAAHEILLTETTRGVRKASGEPFTYKYYGYRERLAQPITTTIAGKSITREFKNHAVPMRKAKSAGQAVERSHAVGAKIQSRLGQRMGPRARAMRAFRGEL